MLQCLKVGNLILCCICALLNIFFLEIARFLGIFRFIRDYIFATYSQRAFCDVKEKWQLVVACLKHIQM